MTAPGPSVVLYFCTAALVFENVRNRERTEPRVAWKDAQNV
jgi:hypothetical protein